MQPIIFKEIFLTFFNGKKNFDLEFCIDKNNNFILLQYRALKINNKVKVIFVKDRPGHDFRYALNSNKIKKKLGWKSKISFEAGKPAKISTSKLSAYSANQRQRFPRLII